MSCAIYFLLAFGKPRETPFVLPEPISEADDDESAINPRL
jgi:hypothetical protein